MFSQWQSESEPLKNAVLHQDAKFLHMNEFLKDCDESENQAVLGVISKYFFELNEIFVDRAAGSTEYPGIDYEGVL